MFRKSLILLSIVLLKFTLAAQGSDESTSVESELQIISHNLGEQIPCFQKLEIGVPLPNSIQQKVEHFTKGTGGTGNQLNPYLEWDLRVFAEFRNEQNANEVIVIDGFYTKDFTTWHADKLPFPKNKDSYDHQEYKMLGGYKEKKNLNDFRLRFAPPSPGKWSVIVTITEKEKVVKKFPELSFIAVQGADQGYLHVSNNQRFLAKGNDPFYPLGCNLSWPETDTISDPELFNYLCYRDRGSNIYYRSNEGYRDNFTAPRVYDKYRKNMKLLADNGANYLRTIMYPSTTEIEWEEVGNYTDRLAMAQEMDEILAFAEENGLYLHWNLQIHYSFQLSERAYYRAWAWNSKMNGKEFAYRKLIKSDDPVDFFRHEEAKKYYKQRLRYILSRWGYSPNVAVWELFSEITNVGSSKADHSGFYMEGENYKIYRDWQVEMANYLKSMYYGKIHLVTASYGGPKHWKDDTFHDPAFDVMTSNIYDFGAPDFASFFIKTAAKHYLHDVPDTAQFYESYASSREKFGTENYQIRKPLIYSETDPIDAMCDSTRVEIRRSMWNSLFSGLAGSLSWDLRFHSQYYPIFNEMNSFIQLFNFMEGDWNPGSMDDVQGNWVYSEENVLKMNPKKRSKDKSADGPLLADVSYLRSKDKNFAIGVISNNTYNVKTVSNCFPENNWPANYESLSKQQSVSLKLNGARLSGMNKGKYDFHYFLVSNVNTPVATSSDRGPVLQMEYKIAASDDGFVVLFVANKKNHDWQKKRKLTKDEIKQKRMK